MAAQAQKDLYTALAQAQDQFEEKQAQMQQKREQELQAQFDGLQKQAEKLIDVTVHQACEIRQGLAEHDPLRGAEAHN
jgi:anion-transporting  ArsA/GET3 family ATPase